MKRTLLTLAGLLVAGSTLVAAMGDSDADDKAVREVVDSYFKGVTQTDRSLLEKAWDTPNAHMKYVRKDEDGKEAVHVIPIAKAFDNWLSREAPSSTGRVLSLDIVDGKMAMVKYQFIYGKTDYTDCLSLYKINGDWKIVNKVFVGKKL